MVQQLKRWFATFGVVRFLRCDHGSPFSSKAFNDFCDDFCIDLHLCALYNTESSGATERGVELVKALL